MENQEKYQAEHVEHKKGAPVVMIVSTIILTLGLIALVVLYYNQKSKMVEMEQVLTEEKDSLANELRMMMYGYDTLKTSNDTLNAELLRERNRIQKLLEVNASNAQLIRKYKAEITTMRDIMKSYIVQPPCHTSNAAPNPPIWPGKASSTSCTAQPCATHPIKNK